MFNVGGQYGFWKNNNVSGGLVNLVQDCFFNFWPLGGGDFLLLRDVGLYDTDGGIILGKGIGTADAHHPNQNSDDDANVFFLFGVDPRMQ